MIKSYEDIKREYEYIRQGDYLRYEDKKNEIYEMNPKLKELDLSIIKLYTKIGMARIENKPIDELEKQLENIQSERNTYIKEHNISAKRD